MRTIPFNNNCFTSAYAITVNCLFSLSIYHLSPMKSNISNVDRATRRAGSPAVCSGLIGSESDFLFPDFLIPSPPTSFFFFFPFKIFSVAVLAALEAPEGSWVHKRLRQHGKAGVGSSHIVKQPGQPMLFAYKQAALYLENSTCSTV